MIKGRLATLVVSTVFAITGVGTALLGAALPAMLAEWHLSDRSGGWLLFSAFAGSAIGALLVHGFFRFTAAIGLGATALGTFLLYSSKAGPPHPAFFLYGLGLGGAMTAISLWRSRAVGPARNHAEMNRLNLLWALGACCAPALALHSLHMVSVNRLLRAETAISLLCCALLFFVHDPDQRTASSAAGQPRPLEQPLERPLEQPLERPAERLLERLPEPFAPLRMCLFAGAAVGLESAIGSWLTTYTQRAAHGSGLAVSATSAFWVGLLLSRLAHSMRLGRLLQTRRGVGVHLAFASLAVVLLVAAPFETTLLAAAVFAGWGLGPLYPLVLSVALPQYRSGAVFVTAGVGASLLPWLTGALSTSCGSLRAGMLVPCVGVALLLAAALWMWREIPEYPQTPA